MTLLYLTLMAAFNRARGSRFWNTIPSTTETRLLATLGMVISLVAIKANLSLFFLWPLLMLWCIPAWDAYWSAEIGHDPNHSRLWGLAAMALRMTLAAPAVLAAAYLTQGNYWPAAATPFLALPYFLFGFIQSDLTIPRSEYAVGALLGILLLLALP